MKKRLEIFLLLYVPVMILSEVMSFLYKGSSLREMQLGSDGYLDFNISLLLVLILAYLKNIVVAGWLLSESKRGGAKKYLWAVFGLFAGLWGVAFYLLTQLFEDQPRPKGRMKSDAQEEGLGLT